MIKLCGSALRLTNWIADGVGLEIIVVLGDSLIVSDTSHSHGSIVTKLVLDRSGI